MSYYYYNPNNHYVYRGGKGWGSPVRECKTISEEEAKRIDKEEKAIREAERRKK